MSVKPSILGDFEQLVLFAALRLGPEGYGATIQREIDEQVGRDVSLNAVYTTLERLEAKGLVRSWIGEPTAARGGRRKRHYEVTSDGAAALRHAYRTFMAITAGLERRLSGR